MQLDEAKTILLLYFARALAINRELSSPVNRALLLSLIPLEYNFFSSQEFPKKPLQEMLEKLLTHFTACFSPYLDDNLECVSDNLSQSITSLKGLSRIEYLLLCGLFLSLHQGLPLRVNQLIDI